MGSDGAFGWMGPDFPWTTSKGGADVSRGHSGASERQSERRSSSSTSSQSSSRRSVHRGEFGGPSLERAIAVLVESNPLCAPLKDARRACQNERIKVCKSFIERAKNRLTRMEAVIARARAEIDLRGRSLGGARLVYLQTEFEARPEPVDPSPSIEFQRKIDQLVQERGALKVNPKQLPRSGWPMS